MPPRIASSSLRSSSFDLHTLLQALPRNPDTLTKCSACLFSTTASQLMKRGGKKKPNERKDPYRIAQAAQRKAANLQKRKQLQTEREAALGDPVRSKPTPFLESLNLLAQQQQQQRSSDTDSTKTQTYLNYSLSPTATETQLAHSKWLTEPQPARTQAENEATRAQRADLLQRHEKLDENARRAIGNITSLHNSSSADRTRINIQRCIETFGRHTTDAVLPPKPASLGHASRQGTPSMDALASNAALSPEDAERQALVSELEAVPKRAGPDTGSSEVQVAILTTKINVLAENVRNGDKHMKRALRLLVHKRQKLLAYLRRKERGGPRWVNLVRELGINDAMWKGEISL